MRSFFDLIRFTTPTTGTGTVTVGAAVAGCRTPAQASIADGTQVFYSIQDGAHYETGSGTTGSGGTTLARNTVFVSSNEGSRIALSGAAQVIFDFLAANIGGDYYPEMFGAVGNGIADDTTAVQAALTAAGYGNRVVLQNNYAVSSTLVLDTGVRLTGNAGSGSIGTLISSNQSSILTWIGPPGIPMIEIRDTFVSGVSGLRLIGSVANPPSAAIQITQSPVYGVQTLQGTFLEDIWIGQFFEQNGEPASGPQFVNGIVWTGTVNGDTDNITNVHIANMAEIGIDLQNSQAGQQVWNNLWIQGCKIGVRSVSNTSINNAVFLDNSVADVQLGNGPGTSGQLDGVSIHCEGSARFAIFCGDSAVLSMYNSSWEAFQDAIASDGVIINTNTAGASINLEDFYLQTANQSSYAGPVPVIKAFSSVTIASAVAGAGNETAFVSQGTSSTVVTVGGSSFVASDIVSLTFSYPCLTLAGMPLTLSHTLGGGETATTIAAALKALINANSTLSGYGVATGGTATNIGGILTIPTSSQLSNISLRLVATQGIYPENISVGSMVWTNDKRRIIYQPADGENYQNALPWQDQCLNWDNPVAGANAFMSWYGNHSGRFDVFGGDLNVCQLAAPQNLVATATIGSGATTYTYSITALSRTGETLSAAPVTVTNAASLGPAAKNKLTWNQVNGAYAYNIYGRSPTIGLLATVTWDSLLAKIGFTGFQWIDDGTAAKGGGVPSANSTGNLNVQGTGTIYGTLDVAGNFGLSGSANISGSLGVALGLAVANVQVSVPSTSTSATYSMTGTDSAIIANYAGTMVINMLNASNYPGRLLSIKTINNQAVISSASNIVPLGSATPGTAILSATAGKWVTLQSDGTNWIAMAGN